MNWKCLDLPPWLLCLTDSFMSWTYELFTDDATRESVYVSLISSTLAHGIGGTNGLIIVFEATMNG